MQDIPIKSLKFSPTNPRKTRDDQVIDALVAKVKGVPLATVVKRLLPAVLEATAMMSNAEAGVFKRLGLKQRYGTPAAKQIAAKVSKLSTDKLGEVLALAVVETETEGFLGLELRSGAATLRAFGVDVKKLRAAAKAEVEAAEPKASSPARHGEEAREQAVSVGLRSKAVEDMNGEEARVEASRRRLDDALAKFAKLLGDARAEIGTARAELTKHLEAYHEARSRAWKASPDLTYPKPLDELVAGAAKIEPSGNR